MSGKQENYFKRRTSYYILIKDYREKLYFLIVYLLSVTLFRSLERVRLRECLLRLVTLLPEELEEEERCLCLLFLRLRLLSSLSEECRPMFTPVTGLNGEMWSTKVLMLGHKNVCQISEMFFAFSSDCYCDSVAQATHDVCVC